MMRGQSGTDSLKLTGTIDDKFANNSLAQLYISGEQCEAEAAAAEWGHVGFVSC